MRRPRGFASFIDGQGFHCLYLAAAEGDGSMKIGAATDVMNRLSTLRAATAAPLRLHRHWWLAGRPISERIKKSFHEAFGPQRIEGDWFEVPLPEAEAFIDRMINQIGTWSATEAEMIAEMQRREGQRIERFLPSRRDSDVSREAAAS
jgi:hypothetical protein